MKKILLTVWCTLMVAFTMNAQTSSGNEVVDEWLENADIVTSIFENELNKQGYKIKIRVCFDSENNELVYRYRFLNQATFELFNIDDVKLCLYEGIAGIIKVFMAKDDTGNTLAWLGNTFKSSNTGMRMDFIYKNKKKTASATADEIMEFVYKSFQ